MKKIIFSLLISLNILNLMAQEKELRFYVSSNDSIHNSGIALFSFNTETGKLKMLNEFNQVDRATEKIF